MDSAPIHSSGIPNVHPPSSHRLPTVSAAQALQDLESSPTRCISTGLRDLDAALQGKEPGTTSDRDLFCGGVPRGKVTEIWGPPGVGKTALGMQLAASVLHAGEGVVWVDASHPISGPRFSKILASFKPIKPSSPKEPLSVSALVENLTHFSTPTLAHLIALFSHQAPDYPAPNTSLIIVDSFSTLIGAAFPRAIGPTSTPKGPGANPAARKLAILQQLVNSLQKQAATRHLAVVVLSQCVTKMRPAAGAVLVPAISTPAWEQGLGCRVALFRDWGWTDEEGNRMTDVRFAEVAKAEGTTVPEGRRGLVGFSIHDNGLQSLARAIIPPLRGSLRPHHTGDPPFTPSLPQKRKLSVAELEIPDSEEEDDEDYGWAEEDEEDIPAMPPQWQGSEDILVPPERELEGEDEGMEEVERGDGEELPVDARGDARAGGGRGIEVGDSEDEEAL